MDLHLASFQQLRWAVQALAATADDQLSLFPDFVDKPFELVDDFDNWWQATRWRTGYGLIPEEIAALDAVQRVVDALPREAYTEEALRSDQAWAEVRAVAQNALRALAWPSELPPRDSSVQADSSSTRR